jgi:metal-sulfur cluster biosynthetic enzyme
MPEAPGTNRPVWDAEATNPEIATRLRDALSQVIDPEIGLSVIQLGLIRNFKIEDGQATMRMILTTPFCPYGPALIDLTRTKAEEGLGMPVAIELGMEVWDFSMMEESAAQDWGFY